MIAELNIDPTNPNSCYAKIYEIIKILERYNDEESINVATTGSITEKICRWALDGYLGDSYYQLTGKTSDLGAILFDTTLTVNSVSDKVRSVRKIDDGSL